MGFVLLTSFTQTPCLSNCIIGIETPCEVCVKCIYRIVVDSCISQSTYFLRFIHVMSPAAILIGCCGLCVVHLQINGSTITMLFVH